MSIAASVRSCVSLGALVATCVLGASAAWSAGPEVVAGPSAEPDCFVPWADSYEVLQVPGQAGSVPDRARQRLHRQHLAHSDDQDRQGLCQPAGSRRQAQGVQGRFDRRGRCRPDLGVNNFIDSGYDAVIVNAQNPKAFAPVIKRAKDAGVVLVAFDNILDTEDAINVNVDQKGLGVLWANWLIKHVPNGGKLLEVRGVEGTSVDRDRHDGIHETLAASGKKWEVVEVVGKWDDPTAQKVTADAIAVQKQFDGITAQGGDTGVVQAMIDAKHPFVPFGGETENGFRKFCAKHSADGLKCSSAGTGPAQVAVAVKTAIAALEGQVVPQSVKLPLAIVEDPNFKENEDFYPDQSDNFFVGNAFPTCGINFTAQEIMGQSEENQ